MQPRLDVVRWRRERYDLRRRFRGATEHPALDGCDLAPRIEGAPDEVLVITDDEVGRFHLDAPDTSVRPLCPRDGTVLDATPGAMVCATAAGRSSR